MTYTRIWHIIFFGWLAAMLMCCTGGANKTAAADDFDSINIDALADTFSAETKPKTVAVKIRNEQQAKEYITDNSDKFEGSIIPRMLDEVPEYAIKLLNNPYERFIVVDKARMKVILYNRYGVVEKSYTMACSKHYGTKHKRADNRTPEGFFSVEGIYDSTDWLFTDDDGHTSKEKGQFGPRFIRLRIPNTYQIGIHGTSAPWSLGGRRSHGCIRIANENILELVELVEPGMPVIVSPGPKDMAVNIEEGYDIPAITTGKWRPQPEKPKGKKEEQTDTIAPADTIFTPDSIPAPRPVSPADTIGTGDRFLLHYFFV